MTVLAEIRLAADPARWTDCGFTVERAADGAATCTIGLVRLAFVDPGEGSPGIRSLGLAGGPEPLPAAVDGLALHVAEPPAQPGRHPNGAIAIDHVAVLCPDLDRTIDAVVDGLGIPLKRIREAGAVRQAFFRLGAPILELVRAPGVEVPQLWGLVASLEDFDTAVERYGDRLTDVKAAVQPGRRIATVRTEVGLGTAVALMSPHVRVPG
ncbi:MAG: VOC family protein [Acidimicrobiales bacterium]